MPRLIASLLILGGLSLAAIGCAEKSTSTTERTTSTPGGTTTTTHTIETKKSGENPPP